jgi:serine/threonine-protein kinase
VEQANASTARGSSRTRVAGLSLVAASAAMSALAIYQWVELWIVLHGGRAVCNVNTTLNCEAVWSSSFASRVHHYLHMPLAGLGLVWGLSALFLSVRLVRHTARGEVPRRLVPPIKLLAVVGVLCCITFAAASLKAGALCLTCLGTYVMVAGFAFVALFLLPEPAGILPGEWPAALGWSAVPALAFYLVLLVPGAKTPPLKSAAETIAAAGASGADLTTAEGRERSLVAFIQSLSPRDQSFLRQLLDSYRAAPIPPGVEQFRARVVEGDAKAPVRIVELTDVKCSHCRHLGETLEELHRRLPPGLFSVEPRYFPLDGECNPLIPSASGDGTRCAGARAQVCLEGTAELPSVRHEIFQNQPQLTAQLIEELASKGSVPRPVLDSCMGSPATTAKLEEDIRYAQLYNIQGTPLVLINGKEGAPAPAFLYAMILAQGNTEDPAFALLASNSAATATSLAP